MHHAWTLPFSKNEGDILMAYSTDYHELFWGGGMFSLDGSMWLLEFFFCLNHEGAVFVFSYLCKKIIIHSTII